MTLVGRLILLRSFPAAVVTAMTYMTLRCHHRPVIGRCSAAC
jgi:hypothetical protein